MPRIAYMVIATLPTRQMADDYVAWLRAGHVAAVIKGGATAGEVIRLDSASFNAPQQVMSRYEFPSRDSFDRYVRDTAPSLRAEGLTKFGSDRGVKYQRFVGELQAK